MPNIKKFYLERAKCLCGRCPERAYLSVWSEESRFYSPILTFFDDQRLDDDVLDDLGIPDIMECFIDFLREKGFLEDCEIEEGYRCESD
jgi:hypothetical protein